MHTAARIAMALIGLGILYQLGRMVHDLKLCRKETGTAMQFTPGNLRGDLSVLMLGELVFIAGFLVFTAGAWLGRTGIMNIGEAIVMTFFIMVMVVLRRWNLRLRESITR
jgi:hypothetical protein